MSDSYDDYEAKIQLAEHAWEKRVVKTEHDRAVELGKAYERGWNAALAQREWVGLTDEEVSEIIDREIGFNSCWGPEEAFARAVEEKLKEKNHG
jgi:hypothetical protein